jgi:hypothetical protein
MLVGSDCNNNALRQATGVKRGDTVGLEKLLSPPFIVNIFNYYNSLGQSVELATRSAYELI